MGEEEKGKKEEEKPKVEEEKKKDEGEAKPVAAAEEVAPPPPPPPPPEEIVMRVFMHCEGCARKVRRCLKGFDGVEEVKTDCRSWKVVVKGKKAAEDPLKVVERVQKKSGRKVELLSPMPPPKVEKEEEKKVEEEKPKIEEKKEEPVVISVVLKVHMHCEACAQEIKKRILKMKGVQAAEADLKSSQVTVKGVFTAPELVEYVHKRTGKHAAVVKQEPAEKKPEPAPAPETDPKTDSKADTTPAVDSKDKPEAAGGDAAAAAAEKKDEASTDAGAAKEKDAGGEAAATAAEVAEEAKVVEMKKYEYLYYQRYHPMEYAYPPQIFSDENPNACAVM
ncbi:Copper chaperone domain-containing protein [Dioscorea alata]|uniref:Copper chaperone domain-containing protein n=2 Tax=Dioscorea alata TaxID=55571 RepID=A0ACB7V9T4_DIOAL|nr:Copper chaperone domain-containing protein [Dioscorea alata]